MRGRNLFLLVAMALLIGLGFAVFKVDQPVQPSGPVAAEILTTIGELAMATGATLDKATCRMITKQYVMVICQFERMQRSEATRHLISTAWTSNGERGGALLEFSRGKDHLTIEDGPGGSLAVSVIRQF